MRSRPSALFLALLLSCFTPVRAGCPDSLELLDSIWDASGLNYRIYTDGRIFTRDSLGACAFYQQYFDPAFLSANYLQTDTAIYEYTESRALFRLRNYIRDSFETYSRLNDCIARSLADSLKNWFAFTLQGPLTPTVPEYVALRQCILNETCTFRDNRIDMIDDPLSPGNRCMKFLAVAPSATMVTSKSSIENTALFFLENDTLLFEGRFLVQTGMPYSIADFESQWFESSPGPRIILSNNRLGVELKYGPKPIYRQRPGQETVFPTGQWVKVRLRMAFRHDATALIRLWQDDKLILDTLGRTLSLRNALQTSLEVGISATQERTELCVDDISLDRRAYSGSSTVEGTPLAQPSFGTPGIEIVRNGFSGRPVLRYRLSGGGAATPLIICDIRGRIRLSIPASLFHAGSGEVTLFLDRLTPGIYFCRIGDCLGSVSLPIVRF